MNTKKTHNILYVLLFFSLLISVLSQLSENKLRAKIEENETKLKTKSVSENDMLLQIRQLNKRVIELEKRHK